MTCGLLNETKLQLYFKAPKVKRFIFRLFAGRMTVVGTESHQIEDIKKLDYGETLAWTPSSFIVPKGSRIQVKKNI